MSKQIVVIFDLNLDSMEQDGGWAADSSSSSSRSSSRSTHTTSRSGIG
eukprot:SAG22_NODE_725_length_7622_cov_1.958926_1_plen_48_part_00